MYIDPTDIGPAREAHIAGDKCPVCGGELQFDDGDPGSYNTPEVDPCIWCECGERFDVDWKRHNDKA